MNASDGRIRAALQGMCTHDEFNQGPTRKVGIIGRNIASVVLGTEMAPNDVHSASMRDSHCGLRRIAIWKLRKSTPASKNILVLFAAEGIFIYEPATNVREAPRYSGLTNQDVLGHLARAFGPAKHIRWSAETAVAGEVARLKAEVAACKRLLAELMRPRDAPAPPVPAHAIAIKATGRSFHTYHREIRGFFYEFSHDFRPDLVPAAEWDANLLLKYMRNTRHAPDRVFPRVRRIVSCTPRFDTNCDFGVVFEHPVTKEEVFLEMCKAFATLCNDYRLVAHAYQLSNDNEAGCA